MAAAQHWIKLRNRLEILLFVAGAVPVALGRQNCS